MLTNKVLSSAASAFTSVAILNRIFWTEDLIFRSRHAEKSKVVDFTTGEHTKCSMIFSGTASISDCPARKLLRSQMCEAMLKELNVDQLTLLESLIPQSKMIGEEWNSRMANGMTVDSDVTQALQEINKIHMEPLEETIVVTEANFGIPGINPEKLINRESLMKSKFTSEYFEGEYFVLEVLLHITGEAEMLVVQRLDTDERRVLLREDFVTYFSEVV